MVVTTALYIGLIIGVAGQRLSEVRQSRRYEAALKARGGVEHAPIQLRVMVVLHTAWLLSATAEPLLFARPFSLPLAASAFSVFLLGQLLRYSGRRALGERWTVSIVTLPGAPMVTSGIFQYLRHPIYVGVALEIAALPLIHSAWITALVFSALNGAVLLWRISEEERALGLRAAR